MIINSREEIEKFLDDDKRSFSDEEKKDLVDASKYYKNHLVHEIKKMIEEDPEMFEILK